MIAAAWRQLLIDERGFIGTGAAIAFAIGTGASAAGSIYAAKKQARASKEALAYAKEEDRYRYATEANRYAALMEGSQPYISTGGAADARMAELLGLPAPTASAYPPPRYPAPPIPGDPANDAAARRGKLGRVVQAVSPEYLRAAAEQAASRRGVPGSVPTVAIQTTETPPTGGGVMVTMQAPDGTIKQVPASEQAHWEARGAQKVG